MGFERLQVYHYRNLKNASIDLSGPEIFLVGENGQGKTNFIEALYLLCFGASFRTRNDLQLIRLEETEAAVSGEYRNKEGLETIISIKILRPGKKEIRVNDKTVRDRRDLIENIPCIIFSHQDFEFITGPPEQRRRFFNQTLSLFDPLFIDVLRGYRKILRSRNILLQQGQRALIDPFSQQLAGLGMEIQIRRAQIVDQFNRTFTPLVEQIADLGEEIKIEYRPSWRNCTSEKEVFHLLEESVDRDLRMEMTTTGPHRDIFKLLQGKRNFATLGSTGQIRLSSLILRVAQAIFFHQQSRRRPTLLLDDVLLELDAPKRERFIKSLPEYEQAVFTFLPDEPFEQYQGEQTRVYRVKQGSFEEEK